MQKWIIIARYFYGNSYTVNRYVFAESREGAYCKAQKKFPERWHGWSLQEITVHMEKYVRINVKHHLDEPMEPFKKPKIKYDPLPRGLSRKQRAKHITGKTV